MTLRGRLIVLFPVLMFVLGSVAVISFIRDPSLAGLITVVFVWYLLPPLCFRLHDWMCPLRVGREDLCDSSKYSAWWGSQQFQIVYAAIPQLEILLRLIPGAYSAWLRLWGSRIGRGVYWTPVLEVIDRSLAPSLAERADWVSELAWWPESSCRSTLSCTSTGG